ncbi:MAG: DNA mismatch repair endonuclease MutL, partial [Anaerolineaceae bacterium]|nr:DNA mismatch repair endonuclease MutL [Anaerolineaceae bacterium]
MGIIHKLDPHLVNQIAAGEVIERPASVVKELIENSLDAEASQLEITVEEGGKKLIRVTDDGLGMAADDLALAATSHATSKLAGSDELDHITTFGFRGEALPSIASVSRLTVTTRPADQVEAHSITVEGGQAGQLRVAGAAPGTTVEVRNLFYNIPARRKFLKADATELGHIVEAVARVGLAYPQVALRLRHNGRMVHDLPQAKGLRERVEAFYGRHLAESLIEVQSDTPAGTIRGLVAPPSESRTSTKWQFLYINGRYIRDRSL